MKGIAASGAHLRTRLPETESGSDREALEDGSLDKA